MKRVAILQSNYIPWKGYFDLINTVDEFIVYDEVQYTRSDWRNRNKIKTSQGLMWLTIPVYIKGKHEQKISEAQIADPRWARDHWKSIVHHYQRAPYFEQYGSRFEALYGQLEGYSLSEVNLEFIAAVTSTLHIGTRVRSSTEFQLAGERTERLVSICRQASASTYVSGPAAKDYLDVGAFTAEGIEVEWMDYSGYPEYAQTSSPFEHGVTVLDLIFNTGPNATDFMKTF